MPEDEKAIELVDDDEDTEPGIELPAATIDTRGRATAKAVDRGATDLKNAAAVVWNLLGADDGETKKSIGSELAKKWLGK